jgi:ubiquinone/menaquinone biosynthesis C-methylase UbiE
MFQMFGGNPHFVRDYRRLVKAMLRRHDTVEVALLRTTGGGDYIEVGLAELSVLKASGLNDSSYIIDVGCGTGRLGASLKDHPHIKFLGIDVVPELVNFAREKCGRADWRFAVVDGLKIPESDEVADIVSFFSVLTHLTEAESLTYLQDAKRVLKPGGKILASYLDRHVDLHRVAAGKWWKQAAARLVARSVKNTLLDKASMRDFGHRLEMRTEFIESALGQDLCLYFKK